jgi:hypothetical protein
MAILNISESDLFFLSKILFHYEKLIRSQSESDPDLAKISDLAERLNAFFVSSDSKLGLAGEASLDEDEDDEDEEDMEDEDDEDEDEDEDVAYPKPESSVSGEDLPDLPPIDTDKGDLEFDVDGDVFVMLNGMMLFEGINAIKRSNKTLEIWSNKHHVFEIKKISKPWKAIFQNNIVYEVNLND